MKIKYVFFVFWVLIIMGINGLYAGEIKSSPQSITEPSLLLDQILDRVENKYLAIGFSARFVQTATIKALDISDTALGAIYIKPPGMMRWEYESPDPQLIISNGKTLWVYRPEDNQVMTGKPPVLFGDGKGAGFLSDIKMLREKFNITLEKSEDSAVYILKLIPKKKLADIAMIYLFVKKEDAVLTRIVTHNMYGDETAIDLKNIHFEPKLGDELFTFKVPDGIDIFQLDE